VRFALAVVLAAGGVGEVVFAQTRPSTDSADDPRPGVQRFFDAVRRADKTAAMQCWHDDLGYFEDDRRKMIGDLILNLVDDMIAEYRLEQALASKMPDARREARESLLVRGPTPTADELANARFTLYRRLAVINWGRDADSGFPMQYDNRPNEPRWKISMRQWYETTHSSVGDALLYSGMHAKAKDATATDVLAGKFKTMQQVHEGYQRHLGEAVDALKAQRGAATAPAGK
jgi:hypothetical protein